MHLIKKSNYLTVPILILAFFAAGCATIFKGSSADVRVNSAPSGADIYINQIDRGTTPQTLSLKRDRNYVLEFRKEGYQDVRVEVNKKFDLATTVVGNIFSWALVGIVVDLATGAAYSLTPADVQANMQELQAAGYLPDENQVSESDVFVVMLTKKQWQQVKTSN